MTNDVFSSERGQDDAHSLLLKVSGRGKLVRIRSVPIWVSLHWRGRSVLCCGRGCPACERREGRRRYAFAAVQCEDGVMRTLQMTERDISTLSELDVEGGGALRSGSKYMLWRAGDREPLSAKFVDWRDGVGAVCQNVVMLDVLRIHGVKCNEQDLRTGQVSEFVRLQAELQPAAAGGGR